jgi:hypothetical protein
MLKKSRLWMKSKLPKTIKVLKAESIMNMSLKLNKRPIKVCQISNHIKKTKIKNPKAQVVAKSNKMTSTALMILRIQSHITSTKASRKEIKPTNQD